MSIHAVRDSGRVTHYVGVFTDITRRKQDEDRLLYLAHHDPLTGLANRPLLERMGQAFRRAPPKRS